MTDPLQPKGALTALPGRIHCAATLAGATEVEQLMVTTFIDTLAEVALAVAKRNPPEEVKG